MAAVVTRASEHIIGGEDTPLASYCDVADVRLVLAGVEPDDAGKELSGWLSAAGADAVIEMYLAEKKEVVDDATGRDFDLHEAVEVAVDGMGESVLDLGGLGFWPLLDLMALAIGRSNQLLGNFVWYQNGTIKPASANLVTFQSPMCPRTFPRGNQNLKLTISWGYATPPVRIKMAQAQLVAAEVLAHIARANTQSPGMLGGIQQVEYDTFRVTNFARSRYSASIERFELLARKALAKFKTATAISLVPGGYKKSQDTLDQAFGRSGDRSQVTDREPI
ncbi:MAG: hypothetical protein ACYC63_04790 [Armatimonadota bacterium]